MTRRKLLIIAISLAALLVVGYGIAFVYFGLRDNAERGSAGLEVRLVVQPPERWFNFSEADVQRLPPSTKAIFSEAFEKGSTVKKAFPEGDLTATENVLVELDRQQTGGITRYLFHEGRFYTYIFTIQ